MQNEIPFTKLIVSDQGVIQVKEETSLSTTAINNCRYHIMDPIHYCKKHPENCRCKDPNHKEMLEWGYLWNSTTSRWE